VIRIDTTAANIEIKTNRSPLDVGCGPVMTFVFDKANEKRAKSGPQQSPGFHNLEPLVQKQGAELRASNMGKVPTISEA